MKKDKITQRREFLKSSIAAGAGLLILPGGSLMGAGAPSNKLNVALIGVGGRGRAHQDTIASENVVALCDVDKRHLATAAKKFPKARHYEDWRKCLDQKDLDAVICCTTDHTHAFIANWTLNRDLHMYCEKPLANTVEEARVVRATYRKKKDKLATQVGTQRHAKPNFERIRELVQDGAIGDLTDAYAWGNRQIRRPGYLPAEGEPPEYLNYDLWLGPAPYHPYNPGYIGGCLKWNMYWDFGSGQIGDMGSHTIDLVWNAIDAEVPTTAQGEGEKYNPDVTPVELHTSFDFPKNNWRGPIKVHWYQGGMMPRSPMGYVDLNKIGHGAMFKGTKGYIICDYDSRIVLPFGDNADLTYYKGRDKKDVIPPLGHFQEEWVNACKGDLKTHCDFEYGGTAIETMLLGLVAYRVGKRIEYDGEKGRVTNSDEANALLSKEYRNGWTLNG
ncbi:MAG: Gfo/Idh/MocA family oxidoreductase [Sedimentisphaerales bacterium]|nr:Gfo/Idh/MocA family oxidoreductase [Sedimentisphaerales bacterium]